jgi:hypothetical protein
LAGLAEFLAPISRDVGAGSKPLVSVNTVAPFIQSAKSLVLYAHASLAAVPLLSVVLPNAALVVEPETTAKFGAKE